MENPIGAAILVVEDEPQVRAGIVRTLTHHGFTVSTSETRAGVLETVSAKACDAIVLALSLPGADGIDITRAVRATSAVPILILTGRAGIHARVQGLESGADDYLVKPFAPEELVARLGRAGRR